MTRLFLALIFAAGWLMAAPPDWSRIRHPDALRTTHTPATLDQLGKQFADPPAEYRPAPLWVWNDELEWDRLEAMLKQYRERGFGGAFVHPRPGLITEYLGPEWFDLWKRSLDLSKQLGLKLHIYDENSYPAGFAGGHVPALAPDTAGKVLVYSWRDSIEGLSWTNPSLVAVYAVKPGAGGQPSSFERLRLGQPLPVGYRVLVAAIEKVGPGAWTAGFPYVDLTNPRTTKLFLETTYEPYKQHVGNEFGRTVLWSFSDEPELPKKGSVGLPLSFRDLVEFQKRYGYDLEDHIPSLYWDVGDYRRVRFDYWQLLHTLLIESFFEPMFSWCDRNNLQWTGHWWEHNWPYPWLTPSEMSFYAFEHMPGIDVLGFQCFDLEDSGAQPHILFTIKQVASAANQLGRPRVLSETYGGYGWRATFEQFKRTGDWEFVHGVNMMNQHLSYVTVRGPRKRDWPQSFSDAAAWWPYYRTHADHIARLSLAMASGRVHNRVLVLNPSTTTYVLAARAETRNPAMEKLKADQGALVQFLADHQVDFDLGDEYLMDWFGAVSGKNLQVGEQTYSVLVWPKHMTNVRGRTRDLLREFTAAGGKILALGDPAEYIDGRPGKVDGSAWRQVRSHDELLAELLAAAPPRLTFDRPLPAGVGFAQRDLADGARLIILNNAGPAPVEAVATAPGTAVRQWDTATGKTAPYPVTSAAPGQVGFRLGLPPAGTVVLSVSDEGSPRRESVAARTITRLPVPSWSAKPESPNVLRLDFCDVNVNQRRLRDVLVMDAAKAIYREHGFQNDPWEMAVQYRTSILDRNTFGENTGFTATFRFPAGYAPADLSLAVETPELYTIKVNGAAVDFSKAVPWLDPHLRRAPISARRGENTIELTGRPFDVRMSLEAIYLLGDFAVKPAAKGFEMAAPAPLGFGAWSKQGRPFDSATVLYTANVDVPRGHGFLQVELGRWYGSLAEILIDGDQAAILGWPPYRAEVPITIGAHQVAVRVVATPRNVFGPFHDTRPAGRSVLWPGLWTLFSGISQPPGEDYNVLGYGLFEPPTLSFVEGSPD